MQGYSWRSGRISTYDHCQKTGLLTEFSTNKQWFFKSSQVLTSSLDRQLQQGILGQTVNFLGDETLSIGKTMPVAKNIKLDTSADVSNTSGYDVSPFNGYGSPVSGDRLIGREDLIDTIQTSLLTSVSYSLCGLPNVGKTSIGRNVLQKIRLSHPEILCSEVDLNTCKSECEFYQSVLYKLFPNDQELHSKISNINYLMFESFLKTKIGSSNFVLMVDGLDAVLNWPASEASALLNRIHFIADNKDEFHGVFLFLSNRFMSNIQSRIQGVVLASSYRSHYVSMLTEVDIEKMLNRGNFNIPNAAKKLKRVTGGHPYLIECLLHEAWKRVHDGKKAFCLELLDEIIKNEPTDLLHCCKDIKVMLKSIKKEEVVRENDRNSAWDYLGDLIIGPKFDEIPQDMLCLFRDYGLITPAPENPQACFSEKFYQVLNWDRWHHPIWPQIGKIERKLRNLIQQTLSEKVGKGWVEELQKKNDTLKKKVDEWKFLREEDKRIRGKCGDMLEYSYLRTLKDIIDVYWNHFYEHFHAFANEKNGKNDNKSSKDKFSKNMEIICKIRNELAHNKPPELISVEDKKIASKACNSMLKALESVSEK